MYTDEILLLYGSYFAAQALCGVRLRNYRRTVCITYKARGLTRVKVEKLCVTEYSSEGNMGLVGDVYAYLAEIGSQRDVSWNARNRQAIKNNEKFSVMEGHLYYVFKKAARETCATSERIARSLFRVYFWHRK